MYFYELHEGDDDVFSDLILGHADEIEPEAFYELVQAARRRVQDSFETDTLIEAIAEELERDHGFVAISDERLTAAVNVSSDEDENFLAPLGREDRAPRTRRDAEGDDDDDDDEEDEDLFAADYRGVIADFKPGGGD
ncbi:MAG: hypothetical protein RL338_793 [Chloroflexota bacterium]